MTRGADPQKAQGVASDSLPQAGRPTAQWTQWAYAHLLELLYPTLVAAMVAPIAIWPIPRSWDLVNHWARLTLYGMPPTDPLAALYGVKLAIIPNLAVDLVYLALSPAFSPETVIRLAWVASIVLPAWGAWRLNKALFAKPQPVVLLVPALSYNLVVTIGLINFALGMGLVIHALAWWMTIDRRRFWIRIGLFNSISAVLFFCHIAAYAALFLLVALLEATTRSRESWRAWLWRNAQTPLHFALGAVLWLFTVPIESRFGAPGAKIAILAAPMLDDSAFLGVLETMGVALIVVAALHRRHLSLSPRIRWLLLAFGAVIVALPSAKGAADFIDARLAVLLAYLVIASLRGPRDSSPRWCFVWLAVAIVAARAASIAPSWSEYARQATAFRQAIGVIAPGSRAIVIAPPMGACPASDAQDYYKGLMNFVVIDRRALVSTLFTGKGMQPVWMLDPGMSDVPWTPPHPSWLKARDGAAGPGGSSNWRESFDTLIALHVGCAWRPDEPGLRQVAATPEATLYDVR